MNLFQRTAAVFNAAMAPLLKAPVIGGALGKSMAEVSYTGRKSGKEFHLLVAYQLRGDEVVIGVAMPDKKGWWRNFTGDGAPLTIRLDGVQRSGHAVARRADDGAVTVKVALG
ncbi:hypothetical protein P0W64_19120 [Tsukamurella sp. 8F]|uniref:hypothetical protein n=1 Tax=unclassified Tsukamurella TaxID=2633480 RepID=UPI0023B9A2C9|nr:MULTISPECIES: hypothetical protein [unclassified Tsukamurella]MDF0531998.1 hypothetical protein [Tsukamurella sp. 8J]MDF0588897.1 hypothetical protein [Tsukamurella sp. 8F]